MNRILIIEDNKALANLIAKTIHTQLGLEVDVAYKLSEAKLFLHKYNYFVVLSDLNLPDAPNGEVVEYLLEKNKHVIVLSANTDKELRQKILQKNIIDFIYKSGVEDISVILQTLQRVIKNQKHKILVVDDSLVFRKQIKGILENLYFQVLAVAHGEEALGLLSVHPEITLVLSDYNMPVMNGLELTKELRFAHAKNALAIIILSSENNDETIARFFKNGANDYITKPFSKEVFTCRIHNAIETLEYKL